MRRRPGIHSSNLRLETILVVLVCTMIGGAYTDDPVSHVFDACVRESNIPPLKANTTLLKTILEITQTNGTVESVVSCTETKIETMRNSMDAVEWFVGHTFDPQMARETLTAAAHIYAKVNGSACLRNHIAPNLQMCLNSVKDGLAILRQRNSDLGDICRLNMDHCITNLDQLGINCSVDDIQMARAAAVLFFGKCISRWYPVPSPTPMPISSVLNSCGDKIYTGKPLDVLFPPSEITVRLIDNMTKAVEVNRASLSEFCSKIQEYSQCLKDGLTTPQTMLDTILSQLLNVQHIPEVFTQFCNDTSLITSQFECVYTKVKENQCYGGIFELMGMAAGRTMSDIDLTCREMKNAQECRVEVQLRPCSQALGAKMEMFYRGLRSPRCNDADMGGMGQGEFVRCADAYVQKMSEMGNQGEIMRNFTGAVSFALNHVCSKRDEWMTCIRHVQKNATHPIDQLVFKFMIPENLEQMFDFSCGEAKLFEKHAFCVVSSVFEKHAFCVVSSISLDAHSNSSCIRTLGETMEANFSMVFQNFKAGMVDQMVPAVCKTFEAVPDCLAPSFERCNDELATKFRQMSAWFLKACGSDTTVPLKQSGNDKSHGNRYLATVTVVVLTVLTSVNVWM